LEITLQHKAAFLAACAALARAFQTRWVTIVVQVVLIMVGADGHDDRLRHGGA
jgi:hypothetical protein